MTGSMMVTAQYTNQKESTCFPSADGEASIALIDLRTAGTYKAYGSALGVECSSHKQTMLGSLDKSSTYQFQHVRKTYTEERYQNEEHQSQSHATHGNFFRLLLDLLRDLW